MKLKITVQGVAYDVEVEVLDPGEELVPRGPLPAVRHAAAPSAAPAALPPVAPAARPAAGGAPASVPAANAKTVVSPIAGTVLEVTCAAGDRVDTSKVLLILEAMKMKTSIVAPLAGTVRKVHVAAGDAVRENQVLVELD